MNKQTKRTTKHEGELYEDAESRIKDVGFDWDKEQVAYAVMSPGPKGLFGRGGKLLAVPLSALTASPDQKHLVLDADQSNP